MHLESDNIEIMNHNKTNEDMEEIFKSLLNRYQTGLETSIRRCDFIFDCVNLLYYKCHKINFKCGMSYIDSPDWIKNKKSSKKSCQ